MHDVTVIENPAAAEASLDPIRARLLAELAEPGSASTLAARVGLTRQKANYHLRALERHGLVELVEERRRGNCTERVLQATAASYVISPTALSSVAPDPSRAAGDVVVFPYYHCADSNHDGKISLLELTRIIELYNYRFGTTRTGQYHVQAGTEDGYAPGPDP